MSDRRRWSADEVASVVGPVVYFLQAGDAGPVKIGTATGLAARVRGLQTAHFDELWIIGWEPGGRATERRYHERFVAHRMRREWFRPHESVLECASALAAKAGATAPPPAWPSFPRPDDPEWIVMRLRRATVRRLEALVDHLRARGFESLPVHLQRLVTMRQTRLTISDVLEIAMDLLADEIGEPPADDDDGTDNLDETTEDDDAT